MMRVRLALSVVALLTALAAPVHAATCTGTLNAPANASFLYDPFAGTVTATMTVRIRVTDEAGCSPALVITGLGNSSARTLDSGGAQLAYTVSNADGTVFPNAIGAMVPIALPAETETPVTLTMRVAAGQVVDAGSYSDTLSIQLIDAGGSGAYSAAPVNLAVTATVPSLAQVNVAGSSTGSFGSFGITELNFGELATGAARNAFVQVRATSAISVTVTSQNGGKLQREGSSDPPALAYGVTLNGGALALGAGPASVSVDPPRSANGTSLPLSVRIIGETAELAAGTYKDLLTIDVVPQ